MADENEIETGHCAVTDDAGELEQLFSQLVTAERQCDADALSRQLVYAKAAGAVKKKVNAMIAAHKDAVAAARAARKAAKGKEAKSAIEIPAKPDAIKGTVREVYARHGASYALASKVLTRIVPTLRTYWGKAWRSATLGLTQIDLIHECSQRMRANFKGGQLGLEADEIESEVGAAARRLIADLEAGMSVSKARQLHKQQSRCAAGYRYVWTGECWSIQRVEQFFSQKKPRAKASPASSIAEAVASTIEAPPTAATIDDDVTHAASEPKRTDETDRLRERLHGTSRPPKVRTRVEVEDDEEDDLSDIDLDQVEARA